MHTAPIYYSHERPATGLKIETLVAVPYLLKATNDIGVK